MNSKMVALANRIASNVTRTDITNETDELALRADVMHDATLLANEVLNRDGDILRLVALANEVMNLRGSMLPIGGLSLGEICAALANRVDSLEEVVECAASLAKATFQLDVRLNGGNDPYA